MTVKDLTYQEAKNFLKEMYVKYKDAEMVNVFYDRGWGDSGEKEVISIIYDGNGQKPLAYISSEVYKKLLKNKIIGNNVLFTYKARKLHNYIPKVKKEEM